MIRPGDSVVLATLPPWVRTLPQESRDVIAFCVGRTFPVVPIDANGLLELDVSAEVDQRFGGYMNTIYVEQEFVELNEAAKR